MKRFAQTKAEVAEYPRDMLLSPEQVFHEKQKALKAIAAYKEFSKKKRNKN